MSVNPNEATVDRLMATITRQQKEIAAMREVLQKIYDTTPMEDRSITDTYMEIKRIAKEALGK